MIYTFIKFLVRAGLLLFCRRITFTNQELLSLKGPLLLACNHPNSFFDALLLGAFFKPPIHFLARGDAFKNPLARKILSALKAIPIYRLSEGKEYLALNDTTFQKCTEILLDGGIVLIFSEGLCLNQYKVRPLKKGTARIALNTWKQLAAPGDLRILPVSFNYNTFKRYNKSVIIHFDNLIHYTDFPKKENEAEQIAALNNVMYERLNKGMITTENAAEAQFLISNNTTENNENSIGYLKEKQSLFRGNYYLELIERLKGSKAFPIAQPGLVVDLILSIILAIPSLISILVHILLYLPLRNFIKEKTKVTVFYHSALFAALLIIYPIYLLVVFLVILLIINLKTALIIAVLLPLSAFVTKFWLSSIEACSNYFRLPKTGRLKLLELLK